MKLRFAADLRSLAFVAGYYALVAYQWHAAPRALAVAVPLFLFTCVLSFLCAVITHNSIHSPVFTEALREPGVTGRALAHLRLGRERLSCPATT